MDNPNAAWENCDYLYWPTWYAYLSWIILAIILAFGAYSSWLDWKGLL